jgi:hypothetical protein
VDIFIHEPLPIRDCDRLCAAVDAELGEQALDVRPHRLRADEVVLQLRRACDRDDGRGWLGRDV